MLWQETIDAGLHCEFFYRSIKKVNETTSFTSYKRVKQDCYTEYKFSLPPC